MIGSAAGTSIIDTINLSQFEKAQAELISLPKKQKTQYAIVEVESRLHRRVYSTLRKNYSVAEIGSVFLNSGWTEEQIDLFWKVFFRKEDKRKNKKTTSMRVSSKKVKAIPHEDNTQDNSASHSASPSADGNASQNDGLSAQSIAENDQPLSGGHFELPPDTEDI